MPSARTREYVIRFRLPEVLARRGWTPYRLAQETGLTVPTAYRLANPGLRFGRFTADTIERLCVALEVQPGELLQWVPDIKPKPSSPKRRRSPAARTPARSAR
ncbi:MAG: helix-turn-helix transcriptional regulator [Gemmatimonadota bacterium]|nr:helix-turn-helix transcriptional regulator [Gemmatimonadota bacterium]